MISQGVSQPSVHQGSFPPHLHLDGDTCPWCEQEIPPERMEEVNGRIVARQHEHARAITERLEQQFAASNAQADARHQADLDRERRTAASNITAALEEARKEAEAATAVKLAEAEKLREDIKTELDLQLSQERQARTAAEQVGTLVQKQLELLQLESAAALATAVAESERREKLAREEAAAATRAAVAGELLESERLRMQAEKDLQDRLAEARTRFDGELGEAKAETAKAKEEASRVQAELAEAAETMVRERTAEATRLASEAEAGRVQAQAKLDELIAQQGAAMEERLGSQREVMEKAKDDAVNLERARAFEETQKLSGKVAELSRALEKKKSDELGEGAEVDLFEALKAEFPQDSIKRVGKGDPGADVIHIVRHNGRECGTIVYDSKNHAAWRNDHVAKLVRDQIAVKAEHAILSTRMFPQGARQLHKQDGVLLANPARVIAIVTIIRDHMLRVHVLRLSAAEREGKTAALYDFITSEGCERLFGRIDAHATELLDHQVAEKRWHERAWRKQGEAICSIQKAKAELSRQIDGIIGTAEVADMEDLAEVGT